MPPKKDAQKHLDPKKILATKKKDKDEDKFTKKINKKAKERVEQEQVNISTRNFENEEKKRLKFLEKLLHTDEIESLLENFSEEGDDDRALFVSLLFIIHTERKLISAIKKILANQHMGSTNELIVDIIETNRDFSREYENSYYKPYSTEYQQLLKDKYGSIRTLKDHYTQQSKKLMTSKEAAIFQNRINRMEWEEKLHEHPIEQREIQRVDLQGNVIKSQQYPSPAIIKYANVVTCPVTYFKREWIPGNTGIVYILGEINGVKINGHPYIDPSKSVEFNGEVFHKITKGMAEKICTGQNKIQTHNLLSFDIGDKLYKIKILYELKDGKFVLQNEQIFLNENEWRRQKDISIYAKKNELLKSSVEDPKYINNVRAFGLSELQLYFDPQSSKSMEEMTFEEIKNSRGSVSNYLKRLGGLIIFVNDNYLGGKAKMFNEHLKRGLFKTDRDVFNLSPKEILKEYYNNPLNNNDTIQALNDAINTQKTLYVENSSKNIIFQLEPYGKNIPDKFQFIDPKIHGANDMPKVCENSDVNLDRWDILYYKDEDNKLFCFHLIELLRKVKNNGYINPHTNKPFSDDFIREIEKYSADKVDSKTFSDMFEDNVIRDEDYEEKAAPVLTQTFFNELNSLEEQLMSNKNRDEACSYYMNYRGTTLERKLNKSDKLIENINSFCNSKSPLRPIRRRTPSPLRGSPIRRRTPSPLRKASQPSSLKDDKEIDNLSNETLGKLKLMAKDLGIPGLTKFKSGNKRELAEIIYNQKLK
jgi:hypothetical protein